MITKMLGVDAGMAVVTKGVIDVGSYCKQAALLFIYPARVSVASK